MCDLRFCKNLSPLKVFPHFLHLFIGFLFTVNSFMFFNTLGRTEGPPHVLQLYGFSLYV